jgi:HTH-type transcriptional regulator / antitoxin HigA
MMPRKPTSSKRQGVARGTPVGDLYFALIRRFPLRPIRSDEELDRAVAVVDALLDRDDLAAEERDYLEVLGDLVEKYETENHPLPGVSDAEMLRHLIEARGESQAQVAAGAGIAASTISAVLTGKRGLNRKHVTALARYFSVSPAVFLSSD